MTGFYVFLISLHQGLGISFLSEKSCMLDQSCLNLPVFRDCLKLRNEREVGVSYLVWIYNQVFSGKIFMFKTNIYIFVSLRMWGLCEWAACWPSKMMTYVCHFWFSFHLITWQFPQLSIKVLWGHTEERNEPKMRGESHTVCLQIEFGLVSFKT